MKKIISALFLATLLLTACKSSKETSSNVKEVVEETAKEIATVEKWIIAGEKVKCGEGDLEDCFQVKKFGSANYENMNVEIQGFTFEPGYKYQLEIKVVPSKKAATEYILVKEMFKVASN